MLFAPISGADGATLSGPRNLNVLHIPSLSGRIAGGYEKSHVVLGRSLYASRDRHSVPGSYIEDLIRGRIGWRYMVCVQRTRKDQARKRRTPISDLHEANKAQGYLGNTTLIKAKQTQAAYDPGSKSASDVFSAQHPPLPPTPATH